MTHYWVDAEMKNGNKIHIRLCREWRAWAENIWGQQISMFDALDWNAGRSSK